MTTQHDVVVGVASNVDPETHTAQAIEALRKRYDITAIAPFERTAPIDRPDQDDYLNGAVRLRTTESPEDLRRSLRNMEAMLGRVRTQDRYAARTIDLDILVLDGVIVDPDVAERPFLVRAIRAVMPELPMDQHISG